MPTFFCVALEVIRWDWGFVFGEGVSTTAVPAAHPLADHSHQIFQRGPLVLFSDDLGHRSRLPILLFTSRQDQVRGLREFRRYMRVLLW